MKDIKIDNKTLEHGKELSDHLKQVADQEDADKRTKACETELIELMKKYNCALDAVMIIGRNGNAPQITIVAKK